MMIQSHQSALGGVVAEDPLSPELWSSRTARVMAPLLSFKSKNGLVCLCKAFLPSCGPRHILLRHCIPDSVYRCLGILSCLGASRGVAERTAESG